MRQCRTSRADRWTLDADRCSGIRGVDRLGHPTHFVVIHCVSSEVIRDWPREKWIELVAEILEELGLPVVEIGTRAVVVTRDAIRRRSLCGKLSIQQTAEVMRRAALFIGIDSGPAHIANAVGSPGVILLGGYLGVCRLHALQRPVPERRGRGDSPNQRPDGNSPGRSRSCSRPP